MSEYDAVAIADVKELKNTKGRILAVDFGEVRTGLAICDASRFLASGIGNVKVGGIDKTAAEVARIAKEKGAVAAVVGLPRNMDGSEGARADRCRDFARRLAVAAEIPVAMTDERLTTVVASRYLNETDTRGGKRKNVIDSLSAEIILQNTLDRLKNMV
ncbi:MAG: Holliday junction resolvase RuvX [Clostridia bacterium]|jgi:putative Holliday junction resolvase|nr:Holliday junction resolvase RuvX [Clostridia bacterium]